MCERFVIPEQAAAEREFLPAHAWWNFSPRFNVAAQQYVPAIRLHDGESEAVMMHWGLIPAWAEGKPPQKPATRVSMGRLERSLVHREAWLNGQRCILPIGGFYAWHLTGDKYRQPFFVRLSDRSVFGVAAVWDRSETEDGDVIESCSVISVPANKLLADIANTDHRMPAILRRKDYDTWLRGTPAGAKSVLQPYTPKRMQAYAVSPRINSTLPDDSELIRPTH